MNYYKKTGNDKISTSRMTTNRKPEFPLGNVCGRYFRYPLQEGDSEGGLRIHGVYKESSPDYPLITYITVVFNRRKALERCMKSVWGQTYPNVEYIIIDGASNDGTLELIQKNEDKIDYYISQKDHGIYDAMNKGIALASGDYICFMNSDDVCTPNAAHDVAKQIRKTHADILCGTRELWQDGKKQFEKTYDRFPIHYCVFRYLQMYHQATYASRKAFDITGEFDKQYKLLADWVWESQCIDNDLEICFFDDVLTRFNYDGASYLGMEVRDDDWIRWIQNTFPEVTREDAECLLFTFDMYREDFFELSTVMPIIKKYSSNAKFLKAIYETSLMCIVYSWENAIEELNEITLRKSDAGLVKQYAKFGYTIEKVYYLLKSSINENREVTLEEIENIAAIREEEMLIYKEIVCRRHLGKKYKSAWARVTILPRYSLEWNCSRKIRSSTELFRFKRGYMIKKARKE